MSIALCVCTPTCIALAADSRTIGVTMTQSPQGTHVNAFVITDEAEKLIYLPPWRAGIVFFGEGQLGKRPIAQELRQILATIQRGAGLGEMVGMLADRIQEGWGRPELQLFIAGFSPGPPPSPSVYHINCHAPSPQERVRVVGYDCGLEVGGEAEVIERIHGEEVEQVMPFWPPGKVASYASFLAEATVNAGRFQPRLPSCGGNVQVLVLTYESDWWASREERHGTAAFGHLGVRSPA